MVEIYITNIKWFSKQQYSILKERITKEEMEKADRYRYVEDKMRAIISKAGTHMLMDMYGLDDQNLTYNQYGKPYIRDNKKYFNVSHSGDWVVHAISTDEVGVDIEEMKEQQYIVLADLFSCKERNYLEKTHPNNVKEEFYKIWTAKEAYVKYTGKGLSEDLKKFNILGLKNRDEGVVVWTGKMNNYILSVCKQKINNLIIYSDIFRMKPCEEEVINISLRNVS